MSKYSSMAPVTFLLLGTISCAPDFPQTGWEYQMSIRSEFPQGTSFILLKRSLLSRGFREVSEGERYGFSFSDTSGYFVCGHEISGQITEDGKVVSIRALEGCFRTLVP